MVATNPAQCYALLKDNTILSTHHASLCYTERAVKTPDWPVRPWGDSASPISIRVAAGGATLKFCGLRPVKRFVFAGVKQSTENRREKWLAHVYRQVRYGLSVKPL